MSVSPTISPVIEMHMQTEQDDIAQDEENIPTPMEELQAISVLFRKFALTHFQVDS